jgi:hypothetical protein
MRQSKWNYSDAAQHMSSTCAGLVPAGNLRTSDRDGPYNISLLDVQVGMVLPEKQQMS